MLQRRSLLRVVFIIAPVLAVAGLAAGLRQHESRSAAGCPMCQLPPAPTEELIASAAPALAVADGGTPEHRPLHVYQLPDDDLPAGPVLLTSAENEDAQASESTAKTATTLATTIEEPAVAQPAPVPAEAPATGPSPSGSTVEKPKPRLEEHAVSAPKMHEPQSGKAVPGVATRTANAPEKAVTSLPPSFSRDSSRGDQPSATDRIARTIQQHAVSTASNASEANRREKNEVAASAAVKMVALPKLDDSWQEPVAIIQSLRELDANGATAHWAAEALRSINALGAAMASSSPRDATAILRRLRELSQQATLQAASMPDRPLTGKLRRASFALSRRVDVWQHLVRLKTSPMVADRRLDSAQLADCVAKLDAVTGNSAVGQAWRRYLLVEPLRACLSRHPGADDVPTRQLAQRALARLTQIPLTAEQQQFLTAKPLLAYRDELRHWAAEPIGAAALLRDIERYETTALPSDSRRLAIDCGYMLESPVAARRQLAAQVDAHYRNANFRMAVKDDLLNALIPERKVEYAQISDVVQNRPTRGQSVMASELAVQMRPDPKRVLLDLVVRGEIEANTTTDAGAARFFNESQSWYVARKPLEINMKGITLWPAEVEVHNDTQLQGVDTKLGNVPVVGWGLAVIAKNQYDMNKSAAAREVEQKIVRQASERVDTETKQQFAGVVAKLNQRVFDPLNNLALDPQLIDAETQEHRFTMRLRVGGEDQIGSHTPRPQAPADSLASVQLHESALNNGLRRLQLDGRTFTIPELAKQVASSLNCAPWETTPDNQDVKITFAKQDPVVVRCRDGQVILTFSMQRLSKSPHSWNNFQVRAFYRPETQGRNASLAREGVIRLMGPRLSAGSQIALRGIFSHALSKKTPFRLIPKEIADDPKLKDAAVTQFVIEDGWIGLSLGPDPRLGPVASRQSAAD
ncbi:MAG: hypothetical protein LLG00_01405 [Planctomycetaceae bacterium]|nr:hypothetical protein [Planctomycetaceae bacterium]